MGFFIVKPYDGCREQDQVQAVGSFYIITVVYLYLTRIMVQFLKVPLPYQYVDWLVELLNEVITLGFYITIGLVFLSARPFARVS